MEKPGSTSKVQEIMAAFARQTGLVPDRPPRRYLWTDAFAACNFLELYRQTGVQQNLDLARRLVDQVHHVLGRHRADDSRTGWISGLGEEKGEEHPTRGGLRIGKELDERQPGERYDPNLEWERDGQYYHYLTKWMHALHRVGQVAGEAAYHRWAIELARAAHAGFTYQPPSGGPKRMYWKMSIDLSYPLVPSMGHHDPLDGLITYHELQVLAPHSSEGKDLADEINDLALMCQGRDWATEDALGIGGLLVDAYRVAQLVVAGTLPQAGLLAALLDDSLVSLKAFTRQGALTLPIVYRLAFRELGLAIGLRAVERLQALAQEQPVDFAGLQSQVDDLMPYVHLAPEIDEFWRDQARRETGSWTAHRDINRVMLATSLAPDGYLTILQQGESAS